MYGISRIYPRYLPHGRGSVPLNDRKQLCDSVECGSLCFDSPPSYDRARSSEPTIAFPHSAVLVSSAPASRAALRRHRPISPVQSKSANVLNRPPITVQSDPTYSGFHPPHVRVCTPVRDKDRWEPQPTGARWEARRGVINPDTVVKPSPTLVRHLPLHLHECV